MTREEWWAEYQRVQKAIREEFNLDRHNDDIDLLSAPYVTISGLVHLTPTHLRRIADEAERLERLKTRGVT